jgi:hypothetical protein
VEGVLHEQVVDLVDGARGGVFEGEDAVGAEAVVDGGEYVFKAVAIDDGGDGE